MLQLSASLKNVPVMSLRTGSPIGKAADIIINPNNLKVEGWYCQDRFSRKPLVLTSGDVRDIIKQGIVVNDHDALSEPQDLVRLKDVLRFNFQLIGKPVVDTTGQRLGKVSDFAVEASNMYVQKLYVARSILKDFSGGSLSVDRSQIVDITNKKIVVAAPTAEAKSPVSAPAPAEPA